MQMHLPLMISPHDLARALQADYLGQHQILSPIDTYFLIDCVKGASTPNLSGNPPDDMLVPVLRDATAADVAEQSLSTPETPL